MPEPFGLQTEPQQWVAYLDLSGGRNTKKDPHALDRNQLAQSDNTWMQTGNALSKRPGNISIAISAGVFGSISAGSTGSGRGAVGMVEGRFFEQTALVVQGLDNNLYAVPMALPAVSIGALNQWQKIGAISGGTIQATQLYDPDPTNSGGPDGSLFIVNGIDTPKYWNGPGNVLKAVVTAQLPTKKGSPLPITPKYVATLFGSIFYAGDSSDPNAVYVSNPLFPEQFTINQLVPVGTGVTTSTYIPAWIGRGDGFNGGAITGMQTMGSAMIIYKESGIYAFTQVGVLGDMVWGNACVSSSVGNLSPRSLVPFDTFHVFLGIDGVYTFDGTATRKISENNPDLFDGPTAQILNRMTAVAVRYGNKYKIYFDNGNGSGTASGFPTVGAWFDFGKLDADGLPTCGTISDMFVNGIAPLRGPNDTGNYAWADATQDRVGIFNPVVGGFPVYSDFGQAFTVSVQGKADFFADIWGDEGPVDNKSIDNATLLMSFPVIATGQQYTFNGTLTLDAYNVQNSTVTSMTIPNISGFTVGQAVIGNAGVGPSSAVLGLLIGTPAYQPLPLFQSSPGFGTILQLGWSETSIFPWTTLGYTLLVNRQRRVGNDSG